jgi:RNA polymerase sigma-B factor
LPQSLCPPLVITSSGRLGLDGERRLFHAFHDGGDMRARDALIDRFMPLARSVARRYRGATVPLEDLEQIAYVSLVRSIDRFDHKRGVAFSSYAVPCMTGDLKRHYRDHGWSVRVPRELQELALRVESVRDDLESATGRPPTTSAVADALETSAERVLEAREAFRALYSDSIDRPIRGSDGNAQALQDTLGDADARLDAVFEQAELDSLLHRLDERERTIVVLYFHGGMTQKQIGNRLGLSQMHISRLLREALEQLQREAA